MTTTQTTASGASDDAIAQAFREALDTQPAYVVSPYPWILNRAAEIDALTSKAEGAAPFVHDVNCPQMNRPCTCKATPPAQVAGSGKRDWNAWLESMQDDDWKVLFAHRPDLKVRLATFLAAQPAPVVGGDELWSYERRHVANEFADMACNGVQWLRNIRDGISTVDEALAEMEANTTRIRALQEAEYANRSALSARPAVEGDGTLYTAHGLFHAIHTAVDPAQGATDKHLRNLLRQCMPYLAAVEGAQGARGGLEARLYNVLKMLDERGFTQATWDSAKRIMADYEATKPPATGSGGEVVHG